MKESYFYQQIKAGLMDPNMHLSRVESTTGSGIPDINACFQSIERWIEAKIFHGARLYFRNSQRAWTLARAAAGGKVLVLARHEADGTIELFDAAEIMRVEAFIPGTDGKSFSIKREDLPAALFMTRKPFNWAGLRNSIFSEIVCGQNNADPIS